MTVSNLTSLVFVAHHSFLTSKINLGCIKNVASTSQKTHCLSIINADKLVIFKEINSNYCRQPYEDVGLKLFPYTM